MEAWLRFYNTTRLPNAAKIIKRKCRRRPGGLIAAMQVIKQQPQPGFQAAKGCWIIVMLEEQ